MMADSMSVKPTSPPWQYRLLFVLLAPLLLLHTLWQAWQSRTLRLAQQRFGIELPQRHDRPVWIHMASVGEVNAAVPLIKQLQRRHPALPIIVTTITATGAAMAEKKLPGIEHCYLPLDFAYSSGAIVCTIAPRCLIIMETELWPQLYYQCGRQQIPLLIANGRLSPRTLKRPAWVRSLYRRALTNVTQVLARSEKDADHFVLLGGRQQQVTAIGNIKFAAHHATVMAPIPLPRPYVVAASTHNDEERQISQAWLASPLSHHYLLVIVPRHPARKNAILKQLRPLNAAIAIRSSADLVTDTTQIYLADTFGELQQFIAGAALVCMGGSLIPRGGQNLIEVAHQGKVALCGPHMENFEDECELLLKYQAAFQVSNAHELIEKITELLKQPETLQTLGQQARALVNRQADMAERYADALERYL